MFASSDLPDEIGPIKQSGASLIDRGRLLKKVIAEDVTLTAPFCSTLISGIILPEDS